MEQTTASVELRQRAMAGGTPAECTGASADLGIWSGQPGPVLKAVNRLGRLAAGVDEQQAWAALDRKLVAAVLVIRPSQQRDAIAHGEHSWR